MVGTEVPDIDEFPIGKPNSANGEAQVSILAIEQLLPSAAETIATKRIQQHMKDTIISY